MWEDPANEPLPDKEWRKHLDAYLCTGQINPDILQYLDRRQQFVINEIKKAMNRIKTKS